MNIEVQISNSSINDAIQKLNAFKNSLDPKLQQLVQRVGALGLTVVQSTYDGALYAGTNDITVSINYGNKTCTISANGNAVGFIEFGTGVRYPLGEYASQVGAPQHGTYGHGWGARPYGWAYYGEAGNFGRVIAQRPKGQLVHTYGNPPANAFPAAVKKIMDEIQTIVQDVFGND